MIDDEDELDDDDVDQAYIGGGADKPAVKRAPKRPRRRRSVLRPRPNVRVKSRPRKVENRES